MDGESGVTRSLIDQVHSPEIHEIKWEVKVVLLEGSLMKLHSSKIQGY